MMKSTQLTAKFESALVYATRLHANQTRKINGIPYITHLLSVAALVLEAGGTETEAIAGLLHDSIEDQGGKIIRAEISQLFGEAVVTIIDGCTEWDTPPKPPWKERKLRYLENLRHGSPSVRLVSLADKLHNARSLLANLRVYGSSVWQEFSAGKEGTLWFYQELLQVYMTTGSDFMTEEFSRVVDAISQEV
jgi:(p)ppGpp synthase/HD superfamily hydrolase